jgi:ADP-ribosyl-[dinitrogen reductase] hydrolase
MTPTAIPTESAASVLLGLACGDALGRPVEFHSPQQIESKHGRVTDMLGRGTHGQPAGTITDDTELALCIARSLAANDSFEPDDVAERFVDWYESGPFDIGIMTRQSIHRLQSGLPWDEAGQEVWEASPEGSNAGNGSVMRCAPYAIAYADDPDRLQGVSRDSSRITHADPRCTYGCAALNLTIAGLLHDEQTPLATARERLDGDAPGELLDALEPVPDDIDPARLENTGYVIHTLQTALYDALTADSAEEAIVTAVNRGGDTDTLGAVAGAVAGARFGADALPERWLSAIDEHAELRNLAADILPH